MPAPKRQLERRAQLGAEGIRQGSGGAAQPPAGSRGGALVGGKFGFFEVK